ncbi:uncharacterized protein TM35_000073110 [Trypanosoma theileri]|uniref:Uncharacterized protein n=1 Tax=Trypanosoma theileri TaxID=67003 RepID=A0A1X0P1S7_9TRYP|nr:uncharacterized protein TM35_000073110 [Trypanosoma theileri]ORC90887.1 hypothetical protein TM35_000073110 [Trypanosoma theileri]
MPVRRWFPPAGCNMNDAGYPFRGEYRMEPPLNHGHGGAGGKPITSLLLRITGSNLAIEKLQPSKGQTIQCELGVDNKPPKTVTFPTGPGAVPVPVPGDGHEYHLTAIVQAGNAKHYCKMILSGSEGKSVLRLRAPLDPRLVDNIILKVDGRRIDPENGWYAIPIQAKECSLEVVEKGPPLRPSLQSIPTMISTPSTIVLQTTFGKQEDPVIYCSGTGESFHLTPNRPIVIEVNSGPFTFQLPRLSAPSTHHIPQGTFTSSYTEPVPVDSTMYRIPELETRIIPSVETDMNPLSFVAIADGFMIELVGDNGASVAGYGTAKLPLPDRMEHRVRITITDSSGRVLLRQNSMVPSTEREPLMFNITEDPQGTQIIKGKRFSHVAVDNHPPVSGEQGVPLESGVRHVVTVQDNGSSAIFEIGPHRTSSISPTAIPTTTAVPGVTPSFQREPWIEQLANALQCPDLDSARRGVQSIIPSTPESNTIVGFVSEQLFKVPPTISFIKQNDTVSDIQCAGYSVTAALDNSTPCIIGARGSVQVPGGHNLTLSAITPSTGRVAASCCMQYPLPERNLDELLVARLLDAFQRHNSTPENVYAELGNITSPLSGNGQRFLPLLQECLRRLLDMSKRFIHLHAAETAENTRLVISIDNQRPIEFLTGSVMDVPSNINDIRLSIQATPSTIRASQNEFAKRLVDAFYKESPPPLYNRWSVIPTEGPDERALLDLLLQMLRDHENELARQRAQTSISGPIDAIQFTSTGGCLKNIRTERPCRLSVDVDGTGFMQLLQGGDIPQGYAFPPGSSHRVHIIARDPESGAPCAETQVTLMGTEPIETTRVASFLPSSCFLDTTVSQVGEEVHVRFVCPSKLRIVCNVDGISTGDTGKSDYTAKMNPVFQHRVHVQLLDDSGNVVFEQRFVLPPMMISLWSIGLENSSIQVDNTSTTSTSTTVGNGIIVKASLDRSPERELTAPLPFDSNEPHTVLLRKYFTGSDGYAGEVSLRVPAFIDPIYVQEVSGLYRRPRQNGGTEDLRSDLNALKARIPSNVVKDLINALIEYLVPESHHTRSVSSGETRIHFRLSGDESLYVNR